MKTPARVISVVVGAVVYLGLAIAGWRGFAPFFNHPALIALTAVYMVLSVVGIFAGGNLSPGVKEDRRNRWVLPVFTILSLAAAYLSAYTDRIGYWTIDGDAIRWLGVVLAATGGALRLWPVFVLGDRFSGLVAIQPGHTLVTTGVYSAVRNPSYLGLLISSFGWSLAFRSAVGVVLAALLIPPLIARMHSEERLLADRFGEEYAAYRGRTWRLIPRIY